MLRRALILLASLAPAMAQGFELDMPGIAALTHEESEAATQYSLPVAPWVNGATEVMVAEGTVSRAVWQVEDYTGSSAQLMMHLRNQLGAQGYETMFSCETALCGGFDFRFALDVTPEPAMHVDLGDFSYLVASRDVEENTDTVALLTSRGGQRGFVHMIRISPAEMAPVEVGVSIHSPIVGASGDLRDNLALAGRATLSDLQFATGSSTLTEGGFTSLTELASYLADNPETRVVLVGHTDAEGSLSGNIALSRNRAEAVRNHLISALGVSEAQLEAEGVGYLAPVAPNSSDEGRQQNRRVEVVVTSTR